MGDARAAGANAKAKAQAVASAAELRRRFNLIYDYTRPVKPPEREVVGRDSLMASMLAAFSRPELSNVLLLAEAGAGKTALVQGLCARDATRSYLEVDLARMIAAMPDPTKLAAALKLLFDQVAEYNSIAGTKEVVLFMDEFHQIVSISPVAVEALKPLLADSGTRGIRVICATTYREFRDYISKNQPLVERLQRINVPEPDKAATVDILRGMAERYDVASAIPSDRIYELIYEYTQRYVPANAQPRKSLLVLDAMIGWHNATRRPLNLDLLADVIYESEGVNVAFRVDASTIKEKLDAKVFAQDYATSAVAKRLQICVADLNDHTKPMSSLLFTGATGTGKTELSKQLAQLLFDDSRALLRMDMTEFSTADSVERFRDELTTRVWERPFSIVLLDEIEKACAEVTRMLLQVLDDGRLSDRNGRETSFLNAYIIMTTNVASEVYQTVAQYRSSDTGAAGSMAGYEKVIRRSILSTAGDNRFPPELLGRIDVIVPFQPLSENTMKRIVRAKISALASELLAKHEVRMEVTDDVVRYLVEDTLDTDTDSGGARAVVSKLEDEVTCEVATFVNEHPKVRDIVVDIEGILAADDKTSRVGTAHVVVDERRYV